MGWELEANEHIPESEYVNLQRIFMAVLRQTGDVILSRDDCHSISGWQWEVVGGPNDTIRCRTEPGPRARQRHVRQTLARTSGVRPQSPHVLFVRDTSFARSRPPLEGIPAALEATGIATVDVIDANVYELTTEHKIERPIDRVTAHVIERLTSEPIPDLVVVIPLDSDEVGCRFGEMVTRCQAVQPTPTAAIFTDMVGNNDLRIGKLFPTVDYFLVIDLPVHPTGMAASRSIPLWTPYDPAVFCDAGFVRDLPVVFLGTIVGERVGTIRHLQAQGVPLLTAGGGQPRGWLAVADYARGYQRAQIALNLPFPAYQLKGHVFEITLCGALLVDMEGGAASQFFAPGVDYVTYRTYQDLSDVVWYYLEHADERNRIAASGCQKAHAQYTARHFWEKTFDTIWPSS